MQKVKALKLVGGPPGQCPAGHDEKCQMRTPAVLFDKLKVGEHVLGTFSYACGHLAPADLIVIEHEVEEEPHA